MAARDYIPLNFEILRSPINWIIILLIVAFGGLAIALIVPGTSTPKGP
jgi:hypothetical protein